MRKNSKIYVILLNYNGSEDTIECVKSIVENEKKIEYEIVVVDNKSTDDSVSKLRQLSNITFIESNENGGFAKGNNIGIEYSIKQGAEYILLLNNDTVIEKNAISILEDCLDQHKDVGIIGSRIMYFENKNLINYCGGKLNWLKATTIHEGYKKEYIQQKENFKYTEFITGCCMLIRKEVIQKIGYLPEEYFMYYEDTDYCMKAQENGFKLAVCTDSVIYHKVSVSSGGENSPFSIKWGNRNRLIFMNKYKKYTKGMITKLVYYATRYMLYIKYILKKESKKAKAIIEGMEAGKKYIKERKNG